MSKTILMESQKEEIYNQHKNFGDDILEALCLDHGLTMCAIKRHLQRIYFQKSLEFDTSDWTDEESNILKSNADKDIVYLSCLLNRDSNVLLHRIRQLGIGSPHIRDTRKYTYDYRFFDIPSVQNSYWAGFIAADGCVIKSRTNAYSLRLSNNVKDRSLLEEFRRQTKYNGVIAEREIGIMISPANGKTYEPGKQCLITYSSARWWMEKLELNWSIIKNKSLVLRPPNIINQNHIAAFITGYLDGDGCFMIKEKKFASTVFLGTYDVLYWIRESLSNICQSSEKQTISKQGNIYRLHYAHHNSLKIWKGLQEAANIPWKLSRKWDKFKELI